MIFDLSLSNEFKNNTNRLNYLSEESYTLYKDLHRSLKFMRKLGIPYIGNPILKLENEVLTLVYSVMQHQVNCELYEELISEKTSAKELSPQLSGLYEMTNILSTSYTDYLTKWAIIRNEQEKMITELDRLSISA